MNKALGATLLIIGTCIGAAMLALPISTAPAGYFPSLVLLVVCWGMMYLSGLFILEVNVCLPEHASFVSMARETLGTPGAILSWVSYLLLLYSLLAAYLSGGGDLITQVTHSFQWGKAIPVWAGPIPWAVVIGVMVYLGVTGVDWLNRALIVGLVAAFAVLVVSVMPHVQVAHFKAQHYTNLWGALPVVITAFGYQVIIPSVRDYLDSDTIRLPKVILIGSLVPLLVYVIWETDVFGVIPLAGAHSLTAILASGHPAATLPSTMATLLHNAWIVGGARAFIFFALASSFVGIAHSLFDFLSDAFRIPKSRFGRIALIALTFGPPLAYTYWFPAGFVLALSYGGIFVAVLNAMLPALMVWSSRRKHMGQAYYEAPGGRFAIVLVLLFSLTIIATALWS